MAETTQARASARTRLQQYAVAQGLDHLKAGELVTQAAAEAMLDTHTHRTLMAALRREARIRGRRVGSALISLARMEGLDLQRRTGGGPRRW